MTSIKLLPTKNSMFAGFLALLLWGSCNTPVDTIIAEPGRRDYEWTQDTLRHLPGDRYFVTSLWVSSPTDVWAACGAGSSDVAKWHYDGMQWTPDTQRTSRSFLAVWGSSAGDVWTCDNVGIPACRIWNFNGTDWELIASIEIAGYSESYMSSIWGSSSSDVYFVGGAFKPESRTTRGIISHYDGNSVSTMYLPLVRDAFRTIRQEQSGAMPYYLLGTKLESPDDTVKIYRLIGTRLTLIHSSMNQPCVLSEVAGHVYVVFGNIIMRPDGDSLKVWKDMSGTGLWGRIWGRSENDFFAGSESGLGHFNGTDFVTIYPTSLRIYDVFVMTQDIFIATQDLNTGLSIIIHGKLKGG